MLYKQNRSSVKAATLQNQRPGWRYRLVQKQEQGTERAKRAASINEFFETHSVDAFSAIRRNAEFAEQPPPQPIKRVRHSNAAPLKSHVVKREGEQPYSVQTSTHRILRSPTQGMRQMVAVLLTPENEEVREAA